MGRLFDHIYGNNRPEDAGKRWERNALLPLAHGWAGEANEVHLCSLAADFLSCRMELLLDSVGSKLHGLSVSHNSTSHMLCLPS